MHLGFIFAMEEEATALNKIFTQEGKIILHPFFTIKEFKQENLTVTTIVSGIGKAFAAAATAVLIEKFQVDSIINIGSAGGVNCKIGDLVISNKAFYHDVDVTAFGYAKGTIPKQPLVFNSLEQYLVLKDLLGSLPKEISFQEGIIATGDQFINDINEVNNIKQSNSEVKALEMEAAAIAQVCYSYKKDFLLVKKISDLADSSASSSFKSEITNFDEKIAQLIKCLIAIN